MGSHPNSPALYKASTDGTDNQFDDYINGHGLEKVKEALEKVDNVSLERNTKRVRSEWINKQQ